MNGREGFSIWNRHGLKHIFKRMKRKKNFPWSMFWEDSFGWIIGRVTCFFYDHNWKIISDYYEEKEEYCFRCHTFRKK